MSDPSALARKLRYQTVLVELSQLGLPSDAAHRAILSATALTLGVERASFWSLADDGSAIRCVLLFESTTNAVSSGTVLARADYPGYFEALLTCRAIAARDASNDPRTREFAVGYFDVHGIGAMLDVPVWADGKLAGVLCFEHVGSTREWTVDEEDFARSTANLVAIKLMAAARSRAEARFLLVSRASGDVVWEWDLVTDRIEWGDCLFETFGHPVSNESASGEWWKAQIHPPDRARVVGSVQAAMDAGRTAWDDEYRFTRRDGTHAYVFDRGFITYDDNRKPIRMTGVLQDVSQRKALEERLLLSDRMASLGTLAAGVAHEINNPLTYVKGNIEHARSALDAFPGVASDVLEALDDAIMGADRMRRIIADLTMFTRGRADDDTQLDLNRIVHSSLAIARNQIRHHAEVIVQLGAPPSIRGSEARIGQVVVNLLVNAAQALRESRAQGRISVTTGTDHRENAFIEVRDNGPGIPPDVLPRVFDPFFTTKAVGEGTGLGLSISHTIVRSAGGDIQVESTPGIGTTFRVWLPRASKSEAESAEPSRDASPTATHRPRVLVVDDEPQIRSALRRMLSRDCDVELSESGRAALDRLAAEKFDVVLCDVTMPEGSGLDVYAELNQRDSPHAGRLVFMTGGAVDAEARRLLERTARPVLTKPLDIAELRKLVASVASDALGVGDAQALKS